MANRKLTKKEQRKNKEFVEKLLMIEDKSYDEWLNSKHEEYIQENSSLLLNALEKVLDNKDSKNQNNKKDEQGFHSRNNDKGGNL